MMLRAEHDIKNGAYWKRVYIMLRTLWPVLKLLRIADSNKPGMDRLYYLTYKAMMAIEKSVDCLDDPTLFDGNNELPEDEEDAHFSDSGSEGEDEVEQVGEDDPLEDGVTFDPLDEDLYNYDNEDKGAEAAEEDEEGDEEGDEHKTLSQKLRAAFLKRSKKLSHDYAITA